jgi:hypothetical protein
MKGTIMAEPAISKETQRVIEEMKKYSDKVTSSQQKSKRFLVKAGICTEKGNLRQVYK